jgi:dephospho-CoA kinase
MAIESWFPVGYSMPDGATCRRAVFGDAQWQIIKTDGAGTILIARSELMDRWRALGLIDVGVFNTFKFGPDTFHEISCGPSEIIAPVDQYNSPDSRDEAIAFAMALKATREIDPESPLQDAIYAECLGRLFPIFSVSPRAEDDMILGYWLTGGAQVSAKSFRRLNQMMSWITPSGLKDVVSAAGMAQLTKSMPRDDHFQDEAELEKIDSSKIEGSCDEEVPSFERGVPFVLAGRPLLEDFFNEHVIDIVRNKERYAALGIGFPSAIVLHGPPGCGKTFAVEQLIEYLGWPSFQVDASSVASPFIHETSKKVAEVFDKAMVNAPSILVIDEMEAFLADRESGSGSSMHRVEEVAEFLRRIPEATKNEVLVVGMTNRVEMIDSAIMRRGRFDHVIQVDPATEVEVKALLDKLLAKLPCDKDIETGPLSRRLSGRPLSDVTFVIREGARLCARSGSNKIAQRFLVEALDSTPERTGSGTHRGIGFV